MSEPRDYVLRTVRGFMILNLDNVEDLYELLPSPELPTFKRAALKIKGQEALAIVHLEEAVLRDVMYQWELPKLKEEYEKEKTEESCIHTDIDLSIFQN